MVWKFFKKFQKNHFQNKLVRVLNSLEKQRKRVINHYGVLRDAKKFLVVIPEDFLAVLTGIAFLKSLLQNYPEKDFTFLCPDKYKQLVLTFFKDNKYIFYNDSETEFDKNLSSLVRDVRTKKFDVCINLSVQENLKQLVIPFSADIPVRVGFAGETEYSCNNLQINASHIETYQEKQKLLLKLAGYDGVFVENKFETDDVFRNRFRKKMDEQFSSSIMPGRNYIGVSYNLIESKIVSKSLLDRLQDKFNCLVIIDNQELIANEKKLQSLSKKYNILYGYSIEELFGYLLNVKAFIGELDGVAYLASLLGNKVFYITEPQNFGVIAKDDNSIFISIEKQPKEINEEISQRIR